MQAAALPPPAPCCLIAHWELLDCYELWIALLLAGCIAWCPATGALVTDGVNRTRRRGGPPVYELLLPLGGEPRRWRPVDLHAKGERDAVARARARLPRELARMPERPTLPGVLDGRG